jgi:hypothetical protein
MNRTRLTKLTLALTVATTAAAFAPSAQGAVVVNEERVSHQGDYVATDGDPNPPARFQTGLGLLGSNAGLVNAAAHSPALSLAVPAPPPPPLPTDDGGGVIIPS